MDYKKHYDRLIERARNRDKPKGYTEKHHIIPCCMGGSNAADNLATLTAREHFVAHLLLVKIYPSSIKLTYAANMMANRSSRHYEWIKKKHAEQMSLRHSGKSMSEAHKAVIREVMTTRHPMKGKSHSEQSIKKMSENRKGKGTGTRSERTEEHCRNLSKSLKGKRSGSNNPMFGKTRTHSEETKAKISAAHKGKVFSEETRAKMRAAAYRRKLQTKNGSVKNETHS